MPQVALKIDVDTDRGTRDGVLPLASICRRHRAPATFFFSLGPDHTGRAIRRIFRPGFLSKVTRTNVTGNYGLRTLLYGTLLPGPHIARRHAPLMRHIAELGFETGIHCYDHFTWQDYVHTMPPETIRLHLDRAADAFHSVFGQPARCAAAPGWQTSGPSLAALDTLGLDYASDTRGLGPFLPRIGPTRVHTPQIPTDLPTLDERLGLPEHTLDSILHDLVATASQPGFHVFTAHAELEGLRYAPWFDALLHAFTRAGISIVPLRHALGPQLPEAEILQGEIPGRSGRVALRAASQAEPTLT
ncbi:MAG: polysaccharide deacetylase family protein [Verrucomicrobiia bacterium]